MANSPYRSRFGDTTLTKVFVGGLAWETPTEELRRYFERFGEILEAVIITDKNTKRSKGYGFVTFRDADSATRACMETNPVIDGRKANCNIASRPNPSTGGRSQGGPQRAPPTQFIRPPSHIHPSSPPPPPPLHYHPYGYMTYPADYGYQHAVYNPQLPPQYHQHMYGPTSPSRVGPSYSYTPAIGVGYTMQTSPTGQFSMTQHSYNRMRGPPPPPPPPPYNVQYTPQFVPGGKAPPPIQSSSHEHGFQLQPPPTSQNLITSETQQGDMQLQQEQQPSTAGDATETSHDS